MEALQLRLLGSIPVSIPSNNVQSLAKYEKLEKLVEYVENGQYLEVVNFFENTPLAKCNLWKAVEADSNPFYLIHEYLMDYLCETDFDDEPELMFILVLAVSYLQLYVQSNYTGPELSNTQLSQLELNSESSHSTVLSHLECDGNFPFKAIALPHLLLLARTLLTFLTNPLRASWRENVDLDPQGKLMLPVKAGEMAERVEYLPLLLPPCRPPSASWWHSRALVLHCRALPEQTHDQLPSLWQETHEAFQSSLSLFSSSSLSPPLFSSSLSLSSRQQLQALVWVEWGLAQHYFSFKDRGQEAFTRAKQAISLELHLTAAMGRRTKYQREDIAQLYVHAVSSLMNRGEGEAEENEKSARVEKEGRERREGGERREREEGREEGGIESGEGVVTNKPKSDLPIPPDSQQDPSSSTEERKCELEIGRRMVQEAGERGEGAAYREILLDQVDSGAAENIILEGGPRFSSPNNLGGSLHSVDQIVLLSLCLSLSKAHAPSPLTYEELQAYIERTLKQATNWMIHSTALLERSWIEFERRKTADRALMQIQALLDQHTTRLSVFQSTYQSVEESAKVQERVRFVYSLVYPSQCELKKDLAQRYLSCQIIQSALQYFRELEMWDEVVTCYQLMQKPQRAEMVVREQLKKGESPYMLTSLADLTGKVELYEQAWALSGKRYARAKRTLGKICYDQGDFANCIVHLDCALQVQPTYSSAWYLKGISCMQTERWEEAVQSFVRCVQQDEEIAQAWANIGAIYMRLGEWNKAYAALHEAYKERREDWKILENLMSVCLQLEKYRESMRMMTSLVDLRYKSQRPLHIQQMRYLVRQVLVKDENVVKRGGLEESSGRKEERDRVAMGDLVETLETLLVKIEKEVKGEIEVWDIIAVFYDILGNYKKALEYRFKQFRAVINEAQWEKKEDLLQKLEEAARQLTAALLYEEVPKTEVYACKMLLQSTYRKLDTSIANQDHIPHAITTSALLKELAEQAEALYKQMH